MEIITSSPFKVDSPYSLIGLSATTQRPSTPPNPCAHESFMIPETSASSFGTVVSFGESKYYCKKPRSPRKKDVKFTNIQEQLVFSQVKYGEIVDKYMNTPCCCITKKMQDDVWSWGLFSEVVLPMLTIIDE